MALTRTWWIVFFCVVISRPIWWNDKGSIEMGKHELLSPQRNWDYTSEFQYQGNNCEVSELTWHEDYNTAPVTLLLSQIFLTMSTFSPVPRIHISYNFSIFLAILVYHRQSITPNKLTLTVLNFWKFTGCCSLKPLWSGMGEVVPARTSPTLHPPSPPTDH